MDNSLAEDLFLDDEEDALSAARATQQALFDTQERMGMMLDIMPMGLLVHTEQGILFANQEACRMLGAENDQLVGQHVLDFVASSQVTDILAKLNDTFRTMTEVVSHDALLQPQRGHALNVKLIASSLPWAGTPVIQILLQDVTDLKHQEEKLKKLSITDELTGVYNRRHVFDEAAAHWDSLDDPDFTMSVLLIDVDHFKKINDKFGHGVGDAALVALTSRTRDLLADAFGEAPVLARIGGEEFLLLLPGIPLGDAFAFAERLREELAKISIPTPQEPLSFTVSVGAASHQKSDLNFDILVTRCDAALYEAKSRGRNKVVAAD